MNVVGGKNKALTLILYGCARSNFGEKVWREERLGNSFRRLPAPGGRKKTVEKENR